MVKSNVIFSVQSFCDSYLGFCPVINNNKGELREILDNNGYDNLWDYPLSEINIICENQLDVVLVDCSYTDENTYELAPEYRWVEIP